MRRDLVSGFAHASPLFVDLVAEALKWGVAVERRVFSDTREDVPLPGKGGAGGPRRLGARVQIGGLAAPL